MTFVSHAQNLEDVVLWRALGHIEHGTYVDVGAADPEEHSITKAFYELGWSGVNIEPLEEHFDRLRTSRPRDLNLRLAASSEAGLCTLHAIAGSGLSTTDAVIAQQHLQAGWQVSPIVVPALPLSDILRDHPLETIHFLKIDVEGAEKAVITGLDLSAARPWIILVESTLPLSTESTSATWEPILLEGGYEFAYFDGLNRFYVAREHNELAERIAIPPNVFDDFIRAQDRQLQIELDHERSKTKNLQIEVERLGLELAGSNRQAEQLTTFIEKTEGLSIQLDLARAEAAAAAARAEVGEARILELLRTTKELERSLSRAELNSNLLRTTIATQREITEELRRHTAQAKDEVAELRTLELAHSKARANANADLLHAAVATQRNQAASTALLEYRLQATLNSHSWRLTAPMRSASHFLRTKAKKLLR